MMESNKLKLNEKKMEAMVVGSQSLTSVSGTGHLEIGSCLISFQLNVKDLGVFLNSGLTVCDHISSVCHSAYLKLCRIGSIHPFCGVWMCGCRVDMTVPKVCSLYTWSFELYSSKYQNLALKWNNYQ